MSDKKNKYLYMEKLGELSAEKNMTEKEFEKWVNGTNKSADKLFKIIAENMGENNESIETYIEYLQECPSVFAFGFRSDRRENMKWLLQRNIEFNQKLIAEIEKVETDLNLAEQDTPDE